MIDGDEQQHDEDDPEEAIGSRASCGSIGATAVGRRRSIDSSVKAGVWNGPSCESWGSDEVQSRIPTAMRREPDELAAHARRPGRSVRKRDVELAGRQARDDHDAADPPGREVGFRGRRRVDALDVERPSPRSPDRRRPAGC